MPVYMGVTPKQSGVAKKKTVAQKPVVSGVTKKGVVNRPNVATASVPQKTEKKVQKKQERTEILLKAAKAGPAKNPSALNKIPIALQRGTRGRETKVSIFDNTKKVAAVIQKPVPNVIAERPKRAPLIPSPFRFPAIPFSVRSIALPSEKTIASLARIAGVFFVAMGALFSLINLQYATGEFSVLRGSDYLAQTTSTTYSSSALTPITATVDMSPDPTVVIGDGTTIVGSTNVILSISQNPPYITVAKVFLKQKFGGESLMHYVMVNSNNTFSYNLDTVHEQLPNGEYEMSFYIQTYYNGQTNAYEYVQGTYTISNATVDTQTSDTADSSTSGGPSGSDLIATTTDTTTTVSSTTVQNIQTVSLHVPEEPPVEGDVDVKVYAHNATKVRVYTKNTKTLTSYYIGNAALQGGDEWRIKWNSLNVPNGSYKLWAIAEFSGASSIESPRVLTDVDNEVVQPVMTQTASSTSNVAIEPDTIVEPVTPEVVMTFSKSDPLYGFVDVGFGTNDPVEWIEVYVRPKSGLEPRFLGIAKKVLDGVYRYTWDTKQTPNGKYEVYSRVRSAYGTTDGDRETVTILNEVVASFTPEEEETISTITSVDDSLVRVTDGTVSEEDTETTASSDTNDAKSTLVYIQPVSSFVDSIEAEDDVKDHIEELLVDFRSRLNVLMSAFAKAERTGDEQEINRIKSDIENLKQEVVQQFPASVEKKEIVNDINEYISHVIFELQELTLKNETILRERMGDAVLADADKDAISDYDEVHLYHTNPFAADTDGDSFIDGVEIERGYDPLNSASEAVVVYESPRETGIVRDDLLVIESVTTIDEVPTERDASQLPVKALISGKGLPNSFVTLYIFSTPVVMTVKTDADGNWSYVFDKELENGEHEIYAGITDNSGRIVAKSNSVAFVKTVEAYTKVDSEPSIIAAEDATPNLFETQTMLLVASIAVAALGLVLILLGLHVQGNRKIIEYGTLVS